jgi:hypothetical protein
VTLHWQALTERQKQQFLDALNIIMDVIMDVLIASEDDLFFCFYREAAFNRSKSEMIPEEIAHLLAQQLGAWIARQKGIYHEGLKTRKVYFSYPPPLARGADREEVIELLTHRLIKNHEPAILCGQGGYFGNLLL